MREADVKLVGKRTAKTLAHCGAKLSTSPDNGDDISVRSRGTASASDFNLSDDTKEADKSHRDGQPPREISVCDELSIGLDCSLPIELNTNVNHR